MKRSFWRIVAGLILVGCMLLPSAWAKSFLLFGGGPAGGTFNYFATGIASVVNSAFPDVEVNSEASGGSIDNIKRVDTNKLQFGVAYSGDIYLARNGQLPNDATRYRNVCAVAYLYGAPAQLIVFKASGITNPKQLAGKKVAVGNAGSGAAVSAERYFKELGLWDKIEVQTIGYSDAVVAFKEHKIDAIWFLVGYPNSSIVDAGAANDIVLLDLDAAAQDSGFYQKYPFYSKTAIPKSTYKNQAQEIPTFQDSTVWIANKSVPEQIVYESVGAVFSSKGLAEMLKMHKAAAEMSVQAALMGISTPLHPGAFKFWKEKGLKVPDPLKPQD